MKQVSACMTLHIFLSFSLLDDFWDGGKKYEGISNIVLNPLKSFHSYRIIKEQLYFSSS